MRSQPQGRAEEKQPVAMLMGQNLEWGHICPVRWWWREPTHPAEYSSHPCWPQPAFRGLWHQPAAFPSTPNPGALCAHSFPFVRVLWSPLSTAKCFYSWKSLVSSTYMEILLSILLPTLKVLNKIRPNRDSWAIWLLNIIYLQKLPVKPCTLLPTMT